MRNCLNMDKIKNRETGGFLGNSGQCKEWPPHGWPDMCKEFIEL